MKPSFDDQKIPYDGEQHLVPIDLDTLLVTGLLVQANSGGGKTWANRRLLEQTFGMVQHIVIDPEGEMHTLREHFDYVLAAPSGGDCVASVQSAPLLARRIMEMGISIIVDIYDLGAKRAEFVKVFIEAFMDLPRDLWHPTMFVIDEAHKFCPERGVGEAASTEAVKDLMTRGRKRGWGRVLATQRISELHKTAAAECNNRLIGRTALDNDQERACKALGMKPKDAADTLRNLPTGHFFAFGPALCKTVTEIQVGSVRTTHERAGVKRRGPTPPRQRVKQILSELANLPGEAAKEARTVDELKLQLANVTAELTREKGRHTSTSELAGLAEENRGLRENNNRLREEHAAAVALAELRRSRLVELREVIASMCDASANAYKLVRTDDAENVEAPAREAFQKAVNGKSATPLADVRGQPIDWTAASQQAIDGSPSIMERAFLTALAQRGPLAKGKLLLFTAYRSSGDTSRAFAAVVKRGWATAQGGILEITQAGRDAIGVWEPRPPPPQKIRQAIKNKLAKMEAALFEVAVKHYPAAIGKGVALDEAGYKSSGDTSRAFAKLASWGAIVKSGPGKICAAKELF